MPQQTANNESPEKKKYHIVTCKKKKLASDWPCCPTAPSNGLNSTLLDRLDAQRGRQEEKQTPLRGSKAFNPKAFGR